MQLFNFFLIEASLRFLSTCLKILSNTVIRNIFLVFDPFSRKREPCDHYFNVDCGDRLELRELNDHWKKDKQRLTCFSFINIF